ncbi:type II toxin-antitoxin system RelE/ParE family toxin [Synechococcus sp. PCC 7336]|uniref:type II toxin-antitoxin system RelE/ParE family toxin n=1 Tax=Synechococcus sp. PCC 7336 TaxID=195250 RepID=UPI00034B96F9|nr:type II toxin-antitoxin system RelE/ParE family toxin [Synechococcus sp. PCC 7336]
MDNIKTIKSLSWMGNSRKSLKEFPREVQQVLGFSLYRAQLGSKPLQAKPLKGFSDSGVLEIVEDRDGDTYRAIYTVRFAERIYVLHAFQKKSKQGIKPPKSDIDLIKQRLKAAESDYRERKRAEGD